MSDTTEVLRLLDGLDGPVSVVGSLNADLTVRTHRLPSPGETVAGGPLQVLPGGKSANQAVAAALLGARVSMVGAIGTDANGTMLLESLRDAGVDTSRVQRLDVATGTALISVDDRGENTIIISAGANAHLTPAMVHDAAATLMDTRALGLCLEVDLATIERAARIAADAGVTVVLNPSPAPDVLPASLLGLTDVLIVNEHELEALVGDGVGSHGNWAHRAAVLSGYGIDRTVVTLGPRGSLVLEDAVATPIAPFPARVVDTTGAGDAFTGTLLAALASGVDLVPAAHLASLVSAHSTTSVGAQASYASAAELRRYHG
ncbi:ribokinase [Actinomyces provencensis]|uniref:ribokinase n=1 Tax=Actinomyces provencensis TaxID=1720198 RepID=UPI00096ABCB7|nr:ribokinase [Actinomyces provencensis]